MTSTRLIILFSIVTRLACAETRVFVSLAGSLLEAEITAVAGDNVTLKRAGDSTPLVVNRTTLCKEDNAYITGWISDHPDQSMVPETSANNPVPFQKYSLACQVQPSKSTRGPADGGPRTVEVSYSFNISNREVQRDLQGAKGVVVILAKDETNRGGDLIMLQKELFEINVRAQSKMTHTTQPVLLTYYQGATRTGVRTHGYVILIMDSADRLLHSESSPTGNTKFISEIMAISEVPCIIDRDFKLQSNASVPMSYISF